jgi:hypothetical protein
MASMDPLGGHLHQGDVPGRRRLELDDDAVRCIEGTALRIGREKSALPGGLRAGGDGDRRIFRLRSLLLLRIQVLWRIREVRLGRGVFPGRHGRRRFDERFILIRQHRRGAAAKEEEKQESKTDMLHRDHPQAMYTLR